MQAVKERVVETPEDLRNAIKKIDKIRKCHKFECNIKIMQIHQPKLLIDVKRWNIQQFHVQKHM